MWHFLIKAKRMGGKLSLILRLTQTAQQLVGKVGEKIEIAKVPIKTALEPSCSSRTAWCPAADSCWHNEQSWV